MNKRLKQIGAVILILNAILAVITLIFDLPVNTKMLLIQSFFFALYIAVDFLIEAEKED